MDRVVRVDVADGVATVTLDRPDKLNAVSSDVFDQLAEAAEAVEADASVRAVLLRGEGRAFCAGLDLDSFAGLGQGEASPLAVTDRIVRLQRGFVGWMRMPKPVVAAVHGYALGAGIQLALAADIRLVAEGCVFSVAEITYGLVPDLGGTWSLPRTVGASRAKELTWTGRRFDAAEALELGVATRVVRADDLAKEAAELCRDLASRPPIPIALAKTLIDGAGLDDHMRLVAQAQATCILSDDIKEAVSAAFERRPGAYKGR